MLCCTIMLYLCYNILMHPQSSVNSIFHQAEEEYSHEKSALLRNEHHSYPYTMSCICRWFCNDPDAIETAVQSVLMLEIFDKNNNEIATGSGFLMFDNMTLITNYHVIENASTIIADSDDGYQYFVTKVLIASKENDIAILQFMTPTIMQPLEYSTDSIKRGSSIVAIGSPIGLKNTVSLGNVSSVYNEDGVNWIQFTAPISHGSSGGALLNDNGQVIGITVLLILMGKT